VSSYASLSHCWGKTKILRLELQSLEAFRKGITLSSLPKTFQDAIACVRTLGIHYLWIDSLCIIQDSVEDWRRESALMGLVYHHAMINLSAAGARDGSEGLHFDRSEDIATSLPVCPAFQNYNWRKDLKGNGDTVWNIIDAGFWERICISSPLFNRAWIVQERLLARRVLHFGKEQLFWECRTDNYCETFPDGLPPLLRDSSTYLSKFIYEDFKRAVVSDTMQCGRLQNVRHRSAKDKIEVFWETLVTDYSRCGLTKGEDKLIALAGMAQDMWQLQKNKLNINATYLAGIWKSHLPHALLWKIEPQNARPVEYRAPTWSWASVDGLVTWCDQRWANDFKYTAEVLSVDVRTVSDEFGQVSGGRLVMKGPLPRLSWSNSKNATTGLEELFVCTRHRRWRNYSKPRNSRFYPDEWLADYKTAGWDLLYGFQIVAYTKSSVVAPYMLVLESLPGRDRVFRRVGVALTSLRASTSNGVSCTAKEAVVSIV